MKIDQDLTLSFQVSRQLGPEACGRNRFHPSRNTSIASLARSMRSSPALPFRLSASCFLLLKNSISSQDDGVSVYSARNIPTPNTHVRKCSRPNFSLCRWRASHASRTPFELDAPIYQGAVCPPPPLWLSDPRDLLGPSPVTH